MLKRGVTAGTAPLQATCANARKKHREYWKQAALCEALPEIRIANRVTEPLCARNSHLPFL